MRFMRDDHAEECLSREIHRSPGLLFLFGGGAANDVRWVEQNKGHSEEWPFMKELRGLDYVISSSA